MECELEKLFRVISIDDQEWYKQKEKETGIEACDHVFANTFIWRDAYNIEIAQIEECAVIKYIIDGKTWFAYPLDADQKNRIKCIKRLLDICRTAGIQLRFTVVTEDQKNEIDEYFGNQFEIDEFRDGFDYVYERERLASLSGKKLAAKRNHIHRFEDGGDWYYEEITPENIEDCWNLETAWIMRQEEEIQGKLEYEKRAMREAFDNYSRLNLTGGIIRRNGDIVAFTVGERLNGNTMVVHFEKAYSEIQGAFQIINQQFAIHNPEYLYFNREDDAGDAGLRKSKLSYYPDVMVKKYTAVESEYTYANFSDKKDIMNLWKICFDDDDDYIEMYLSNMFQNDNMLCIRRNGHIVSMASFLPAIMKKGEEEEQALYVYAVGTAPEFRGQGFAAGILRHALDKYGVPLVLCPAEPSLEKYYESLGFHKFFQDKNEYCSFEDASIADAFHVVEITETNDSIYDLYMKSRDKCLENSFYIKWDRAHIEFAIQDHLRSGGHLIQCLDGFVLLSIRDNRIMISESTVSEASRDEVYKALSVFYKVNEIVYENAGGYMIRPERYHSCRNDEQGYMALTLG